MFINSSHDISFTQGNQKRNIRFGIIGCGWITNKTYLPILEKLEEVQVIAILDNDRERAKDTAKKFNISNIYIDENDFFRDEFDAVLITTPNYSHAEYALKAILNNKHVICEKPTVLTTMDYIQISEEARKRNLFFIPAFVNRFRADVSKMLEVAKNKTVGKITAIEAGWLRSCGYPRLGSWFTHKKYSGGGVLIDLGPHIIDICLELFNYAEVNKTNLITLYDHDSMEDKSLHNANWIKEDTKQNFGLEINVESTCIGKVEFTGQKRLDLMLSWNSPIENDVTYFTIRGDEGTIRLDSLFGFSTNRITKYNKLIIEHDSGDREEHIFHDIDNEQMNSFYRLCNFFVSCISNNEILKTLSKRGQETVSLIEQLYANETIFASYKELIERR